MAGARLVISLLIGTCMLGSAFATANKRNNHEESLQDLSLRAPDPTAVKLESHGADSGQVLPSGPSSGDHYEVALGKATVIPDPPRASLLEGPMPAMKFSCNGAFGYFVEPSFACKAFHYCDRKGERYTFLCDEGTTFNQVLNQCEPGQAPGCGGASSPEPESHPELSSESRPELTSESRPELTSESRPELTSESRPELSSESRRRGQPERPHSLPDSVEKRDVAATPINPDGDILVGSESVQSERLRQPARPRGQADGAGVQDEPDAPQPRVVTISPRVPVSDSIRSTTGRPLQLTDGGAEVPGQFPSGPANSAPFVNQAVNQNPFRGSAPNGAPFFSGPLQQQPGLGGNFAGQNPGPVRQPGGFNRRATGVSAPGANIGGPGFGFGGQNPSFAPGFGGIDPAFAGPTGGFNGPNVGFTSPSPAFARSDSPFVQQDPRFQDPRFIQQDPRFAQQDPRFVQQDPRFAQQDPRFIQQDPRFVQQDPRFGGQPDPRFASQGPAFAGQDPRFVAPGAAFNAPPPDFSSGVPFAFREFGGVPANQGLPPATPTDVKDGAGPTEDKTQGDAGATGNSAAKRGQEEATKQASQKVGRLSDEGGQLSRPRGDGTPAGFSPVVAEEDIFQSAPGLDSHQIGFQQNGFSRPDGAFASGGQAARQGVNDFQEVSRRQNPFTLRDNNPGFIPSDTRFIQGNLEILFPQQFRDDPNGFRPVNPEVFRAGQDGFLTDQERFAPAQEVSPSSPGFVPGQTGFSQQGRFSQDRNNFQSLNGDISGGSNDFTQRQRPFAPDRRGVPLNDNVQSKPDRFLHNRQNPLAFDEPWRTREGQESSNNRRDDINSEESLDDRGSVQPTDPNQQSINLDSKRKPRGRINRGKFPLTRDQFFKAKEESRLADERVIEKRNENGEILENALQGSKTGSDLPGDELNTEQTRLRPTHSGSLPESARGGFNRAVLAFDKDGIQRSPDERNFERNINRFPPEHRSSSARFPGGFRPAQDRFSPPSPGFPQDRDRFQQDRRRFPEDQQIFQGNRGRFRGDRGRFTPEGGIFAQDHVGFPQEQGRFSSGQGNFEPDEGRFPLNQNGFNPNQNQFIRDQNRFSSNPSQFTSEQGNVSPTQNGFPNGQDKFTQVPADQNRIPTRQSEFQSDRNRFTTNSNQFRVNQGSAQQEQDQFFGPNFSQNTPGFPIQPPSNQDRFGQDLNTFNSNDNRLQQNQDGFPRIPNQFPQNNIDFAQGVNGLSQNNDGVRGFGGSRLPQNSNFFNQNDFNSNQFQPQRGPAPGKFPSQFPSVPDRDAFAPPKQGDTRGNHIAEDNDFFDVTTAPPPRIIAPLPKDMIEHMDKSDAGITQEQSTPGIPQGSTPSGPGRGHLGRRRKPPRRRPPPRGHVSAIAGQSGDSQSSTEHPTTHPTSNEHETVTVNPSRGRTGSIVRHRQIAVRRRQPNGRRRLGRRRSTTPTPEVTTEAVDVTEPSVDITGPSGETAPSATTVATTPGAGRRRRIGVRRRLPGGFRSRARTRVRRPALTDTSTETSGQGVDEHQSDALADSTLERPQFLDSDVSSLSGDGLLREPSNLDSTTVKPDFVRRRRPGVAARRRRLRGRQNTARTATSASSSSSPDASVTLPSAASAAGTGRRRYREGDGEGSRRTVADADQDSSNDNTWLDGTTAPGSVQQQDPHPGSRRPPRRRFRPGRRRVNDFEGSNEKSTGASANGQRFSNTGVGDVTGFDRFQGSAPSGFDFSSGAGSQNFAGGDFERNNFGQHRFSDPTLVQNDFLDSAASGPSDSLTRPGRRQRFRPNVQQHVPFSGPARGRDVFHQPGTFSISPSAAALASTAEPVTAPTRRFRFKSQDPSTLPPTEPKTSEAPHEEVVTGRSIGRGPVTIISTGNSIQTTSPALEDTAVAEGVRFSWSEPTSAAETTTRRSQRPSLPEVADLPPDLVDRRHPHSRSSTSLSDMLNGRRRHSDTSSETGRNHRTNLRHRIQHARTTEPTRATPHPVPPPTEATPPTTSTIATTSATPQDSSATGKGDWRAKPWTTSFAKAAAKGSVSTSEEDVSLDSITEMVVATTTQRPIPVTLSEEEPRLPLQDLFDNI